ncbi:unnamed protein product [Somion occarium]|uniref:NAD-dependent epimerase/dehydratase domain-containing protein n=1 Tax=Somion occarium TaxID=3059160 RepID=A0ABP1DK64_9APHY
MPTVTSGKVLVTGANGYVATWIIKTLLEKGYSVRGAVRSEAKGAHTRNLFASYGDKFELCVVEDITKDGAFDDAVKDVDAIEHVASPVTLSAVDPNELIKPAVEGTRGILQSALRHGTRVKRFVMTSSTSAVKEIGVPGRHVYSETNWNWKAVREVNEKGASADQMEKYCASKTLAERFAWDFYEEKKESGIPFDIVTVIPPYIFGPWLHEIKDPSVLNVPNNMFYDDVIQGKADNETLANFGYQWVDVRDLALAHVLSLENEEAGGKRLLISAGNFKLQDLVNSARRFSDEIPLGNTSYRKEAAEHLATLDTSKTVAILPQLHYRDLEDTTLAILECCEKNGWWSR